MDKQLHQSMGVWFSYFERRSGAADRRRFPRGGRRVDDVVRLGRLALLCFLLNSATASAQVRFGFDVDSVATARATGMPIAYGSMWAGAWNQRLGWISIENHLKTAKANGVTPVIQWWYWGDDITPSCVENGCWDARQGVQKDKATWIRMSNELADLIARVMGPGTSALVVLECEFNKGGIENYEPFDAYLADQAKIFHDRNLQVALEFGNWGRSLWTNFDRAVAASDMLGAMALQSSLRDPATYESGAEMLLSAARYYQSTFRKPVFVTDFAFSSYPEPTYETLQDRVVADIFSRMGEFRAAGVQGMIWRMLTDDPNFDTSNYHGIAERHWGLIRSDSSRKASFTSFVNGVLAEAQSASVGSGVPLDMNSDGYADILWQHQGDGGLVAWLMNGTSRVGAQWLNPPRPASTDWKVVALADFNQDRHPDLLWQNTRDGGLVTWLMNGLNLVAVAWINPTGVSDLNWKVAGVGDFTGDGKPDLLWQHQTNGGLVMWQMDGVNMTAAQWLNPTSVPDQDWRVAAVADFNRDGKHDLIWRHRTNGWLVMWMMDGANMQSAEWVTPNAVTDPQWRLVTARDFNNDGWPDLLWQHQVTGGLNVWMLIRTSLLAAPWLTPSSVTDPAWKAVAAH